MANKKYIKEHKSMNSFSDEAAIQSLIKQYYDQYYGNSNK